MMTRDQELYNTVMNNKTRATDNTTDEKLK